MTCFKSIYYQQHNIIKEYADSYENKVLNELGNKLNDDDICKLKILLGKYIKFDD